MCAAEIMTSPAVATSSATPARDAVAVLVDHGFAGLPVVDAEGGVVGTFTEFDALRGAKERGNGTTVGDLMTSPVEVVVPGTDVTEISSRMLTGRLRCLPVVEDGVLVGVVSRRDLLRPLVRADDAIFAQLGGLLAGYSSHSPQWTVEIEAGLVRIRGEFRDEVERGVLEALAKTVPGVVGVELGAEK
ncbi:HPP family protein [Amycolatopsis sp. lyj-112]|uniref:CBS domain-containing protein n=1 Tax=Amycolatopsis sp. lyj-112 TaxID=2789288 RepID=UPI00397A8AD1